MPPRMHTRPKATNYTASTRGGAGLRAFSSEEVVLQPASWVDRHQVGCAGCAGLPWGVADRTEIGALRDRTQRLMPCSGSVDVFIAERAGTHGAKARAASLKLRACCLICTGDSSASEARGTWHAARDQAQGQAHHVHPAHHPQGCPKGCAQACPQACCPRQAGA